MSFEERAESTPTSVVTFDPTAEESPSQRVVTSVAATLEADPGSLTPLYDAIDPDALDALFSHATRESAGHHELWFPYEGFDVCVDSHGTITLLSGHTDSPSGDGLDR